MSRFGGRIEAWEKEVLKHHFVTFFCVTPVFKHIWASYSFVRNGSPECFTNMLQEDGASLYFAVIARQYFDQKLERRLIGRNSPISWPPRAPSLTLSTSFANGISKILYLIISSLRFSSLNQAAGLLSFQLSKETLQKVADRTEFRRLLLMFVCEIHFENILIKVKRIYIISSMSCKYCELSKYTWNYELLKSSVFLGHPVCSCTIKWVEYSMTYYFFDHIKMLRFLVSYSLLDDHCLLR